MSAICADGISGNGKNNMGSSNLNMWPIIAVSRLYHCQVLLLSFATEERIWHLYGIGGGMVSLHIAAIQTKSGNLAIVQDLFASHVLTSSFDMGYDELPLERTRTVLIRQFANELSTDFAATTIGATRLFLVQERVMPDKRQAKRLIPLSCETTPVKGTFLDKSVSQEYWTIAKGSQIKEHRSNTTS